MADKRFHNQKGLAESRKKLRQEATPEENLLWQKLRNKKLGYKFRRQHSVGPFIVDFYCPQQRLIVELDGHPHRQTETREDDSVRDQYLASLEFKILRFWNREVSKNLPAVLEKITRELTAPNPLLDQGGGALRQQAGEVKPKHC